MIPKLSLIEVKKPFLAELPKEGKLIYATNNIIYTGGYKYEKSSKWYKRIFNIKDKVFFTDCSLVRNNNLKVKFPKNYLIKFIVDFNIIESSLNQHFATILAVYKLEKGDYILLNEKETEQFLATNLMYRNNSMLFNLTNKFYTLKFTVPDLIKTFKTYRYFYFQYNDKFYYYNESSKDNSINN